MPTVLGGLAEFEREMTDEGQVRRLLPEHIGGQIAQARFEAGDRKTDEMLEAARLGITAPAERGPLQTKGCRWTSHQGLFIGRYPRIADFHAGNFALPFRAGP